MTGKEFQSKYSTFVLVKQKGWNRYFITDGHGIMVVMFDIDTDLIHTYKGIYSIEMYKDIILLFNYYKFELQSKFMLKINSDFKKYRPTEEDRDEEINEMKESIIESEGDR